MFNLRSIPGMHLLGNVSRIGNLVGFIDPILNEHLKKNLAKSAEELASIMKKGIIRREFGLASNAELTMMFKRGANIPLVASSQLVQGINAQKIGEGKARLLKGKTNRFEAYFVGVKRYSRTRSSDSNRIGKYVPVSLFNVAKKMVKAHTVVLPRSGVKKKVPKRDFVTPAYKKHKAKHEEYMRGGVSLALRSIRGTK